MAASAATVPAAATARQRPFARRRMTRHLRSDVVRAPHRRTSASMRQACGVSMSGVVRSPAMYRCGTGSSQTVCQIPLTGVYQIPSGARTSACRAAASPRSVGSQTRTFNVFSPFLCRQAAVTSNVNVQHSRPCGCLRCTSFDPNVGFPVYGAEVEQYPAPCRSSRSGRRSVRAYHSTSFSAPSRRCLRPTALDSTAIRYENFAVVELRLRGVPAGTYRVIPQSVQIFPCAALSSQRDAGIRFSGQAGIDLFGPWRF